LLRIKNLNKNYDKHIALKNISLDVPKRSIYGLLGPNGAGKTSIIRIVNQITMADSGSVFFDNEKLSPKHILDIGYLPEERGLYKSMKVGEQALYLAQLKGMSKKDAIVQLKYWFEKFEITDWWHKKIQELSKGMAQKIQFIVTVLHKPKLLIFDEPFSGFDPVNAELIAKEILQLRDEGATIIFSTHRMESVEQLCDHVALINESEKVLDGSLLELQNRFKENIFEVGLKVADAKLVEFELSKKYEIEKSDFGSITSNLKLNIKMKEKELSNDLFQDLLSFGEVLHFVDKVPTMNEIFMKAVSKTKETV
jgi:ABC-2 type transport system ATP-binding protein